MITKWYTTIPELSGDKLRRCYVYTPTGYYREPKRRYPVLYMFDGQNVFFDEDATYGKSWGVKDYLDYTDTNLIVAAVECNDGEDNARLSEYAPYDFTDPEYGTFEGRGNDTLDWIVNVFKPYVDAHYRTLTQRENTFIAGSSMGGLMSFYALLAYNEFFSKAGALSPSLVFNEKQLLELLKHAPLDPDTTLYMDYGSQEFGYERNMPGMYRRFCTQIMRRGIYLTSRIVPEGSHCEASWEKQLPFLIHTLIYENAR